MSDALFEHIGKVVHIEKDDIVSAKKEVDQCPIAISIQRDFKDYFHNVTVGFLKAYFNDIDDKHCEDGIGVTLSVKLRAWIRRFDRDEYIEPVDIVLKRYDAPEHIGTYHYEFDLV